VRLAQFAGLEGQRLRALCVLLPPQFLLVRRLQLVVMVAAVMAVVRLLCMRLLPLRLLLFPLRLLLLLGRDLEPCHRLRRRHPQHRALRAPVRPRPAPRVLQLRARRRRPRPVGRRRRAVERGGRRRVLLRELCGAGCGVAAQLLGARRARRVPRVPRRAACAHRGAAQRGFAARRRGRLLLGLRRRPSRLLRLHLRLLLLSRPLRGRKRRVRACRRAMPALLLLSWPELLVAPLLPQARMEARREWLRLLAAPLLLRLLTAWLLLRPLVWRRVALPLGLRLLWTGWGAALALVCLRAGLVLQRFICRRALLLLPLPLLARRLLLVRGQGQLPVCLRRRCPPWAGARRRAGGAALDAPTRARAGGGGRRRPGLSGWRPHAWWRVGGLGRLLLLLDQRAGLRLLRAAVAARQQRGGRRAATELTQGLCLLQALRGVQELAAAARSLPIVLRGRVLKLPGTA
jgi:hypothetical protein